MVGITERDSNRTTTSFVFEENTFIKARDFYRSNYSERDKLIDVIDQNGSVIFSLEWKNNKLGEAEYFGADNLWDYDVFDECIDDELLQDSNVFFFHEMEEYTYAISKIILSRYDNKEIFIADQNGKYFFEGDERVHVINDKRDMFLKYYELYCDNVMDITTSFQFAAYDRWKRECTSLIMMTSLFWMRNISSYGEENPDKCILLIDYPIGMSGLGDLTTYTIYAVWMSYSRKYMGKPIVPVVDFSQNGDTNMFLERDNENIWEKFYQPVSDITKEEAHRSKYVLELKTKENAYNAYYLDVQNNITLSVAFSKYLKFSQKTREKINEVKKSLGLPRGRGLAVKARGTDFYKGWTFQGEKFREGGPMRPKEFVGEVRKEFQRGKYDYLFLATEDEEFVKAFQKSELSNDLYETDAYKTSGIKSIAANIIDSGRNVYEESLIYLAEILIMSECSALIANTDCGAVRMARAWNNNMYEKVIVIPWR